MTLELLGYLLPNLPISFWEKWPAAEIYYRCFQMLDETDGRPFFIQLKQALQQNQPIFPVVRTPGHLSVCHQFQYPPIQRWGCSLWTRGIPTLQRSPYL